MQAERGPAAAQPASGAAIALQAAQQPGQQPPGAGAAAAAAAADDEAELAADAMSAAAESLLLPFQRAMLEELLEEDGLCVLSPGLGLHQVVAVLLRLQAARRLQPGQAGCLLVLGASPWQRDALRRELARIEPAIAARAAEVLGPAAGRGSAGARGLCARGAGACPTSCLGALLRAGLPGMRHT